MTRGKGRPSYKERQPVGSKQVAGSKPSYVAIVKLVKVFNMVSHTTILQILHCYGAHANLRSAIERMYVDLKILLKIGKVGESMS